MLAVAAVLIGAILLYNGVFKKTPAGPASMGVCRLLNVVLGASILIPAAGGELFSAIAPAMGVALAAMFFIAGLTFWSRSERGQARRSDGIATLVCLNISFAAAWFVGFKTDWRQEEIIVALGAAFTVAFEYLAIRALIANRSEAYNRALRLGLSAIIIYDGLLLAAIVGPAGLLLWVLILPNLILRRFFRTT
jgi:4-hydroxybenzoate polyprenyltransferase